MDSCGSRCQMILLVIGSVFFARKEWRQAAVIFDRRRWLKLAAGGRRPAVGSRRQAVGGRRQCIVDCCQPWAAVDSISGSR